MLHYFLFLCFLLHFILFFPFQLSFFLYFFFLFSSVLSPWKTWSSSLITILLSSFFPFIFFWVPFFIDFLFSFFQIGCDHLGYDGG